MSVLSWLERVVGGLEKDISAEEQAIIAFLTPLAKQIESTALVLGKQDLQAGLQVLKDSVVTAVTAGTAAIEAGQSPVTAAETAFLTTAAGEGKTALSNAESGAIKAGVAIAQEAAADLTTPETPTEPVNAATPVPGITPSAGG